MTDKTPLRSAVSFYGRILTAISTSIDDKEAAAKVIVELQAFLSNEMVIEAVGDAIMEADACRKTEQAEAALSTLTTMMEK